MFKWIIQELKKSICNQREIDPAIFNDPLALRTGWNPLKFGHLGVTHKLIEVSSARYEFKSTRSINFWGYIVLVIGMASIFIITYNAFNQYPQVLKHLLYIFAVMFTIYITIDVAKILFHMIRGYIVFDKSIGYFWKGRISEAGVSDTSGLKDRVELRKIRALQLVTEALTINDADYYELNLVLDDTSRVNVAVYAGDKNAIREDARRLGQFLNVQVWDAI